MCVEGFDVPILYRQPAGGWVLTTRAQLDPGSNHGHLRQKSRDRGEHKSRISPRVDTTYSIAHSLPPERFEQRKMEQTGWFGGLLYF